MIPQFNPSFEDQEIVNVLAALRDNWITEGKWTARFEEELKSRCGCKHALLVPNGTLALFAALKVLDIGPGDEVLVPDFTFFGSASAVILTGAKPVLVDVRRVDFTIDIEQAERSISSYTRCIMPVHMYGQTCDMTAVMDLAHRHNLFVVEDAAQGMGVTFGDRHVGTIGHIGCISFFADKTITTGEGGALLTNDDALAERCLYFKNQGRRERGSFIHPHVGYNFRVTDLQAAIGVAQIERIESVIARKHEMLKRYQERLGDVPQLRWPARNTLGKFVPFRINLLVDDAASLAEHMTRNDIQVRRFFYPLHRQPSLTAANSVIRQTPAVSVELFDQGLSLPSGIDLTDEKIDRVCACIADFYEEYEPTALTGREFSIPKPRHAPAVVPDSGVKAVSALE